MQRPDSRETALEKFERLLPTTTAILVALLAWLFLQLDPLGLEKTSNAASRRVAMRLMSAFYPVEPGEVSVVLIDDDYLRATDGSWPLTFFTQGYILKKVLDYGPRTVFVDILYRHEHESMYTSKGPRGEDPATDLIDVVRRPSPAPVIFADLPPPLPNGLEPRKDMCHPARHATVPVAQQAGTEASAGAPPRGEGTALQKIVERAQQAQWNVSRAYVGWQGCGDRYPLVIWPSRDLRSPAYASYVAGCEMRDPVKEAAQAAECRATVARLEQQLDVPISVRWGALPSQLHFEGYHEDQCQAPPVASAGWPLIWQQLGIFLDQFALSFAQIAEESANPRLRLPCPSVDTIRAGELMTGHPDRAREFIKDRYVFIGVHLDGVHDQIASPVHGLVPGATFNAMALDNLVRLQSDYLHQLSEEWTRAWEAMILIAVVALVVGGMHYRLGLFDRAWMRVLYVFVVAGVGAVTLALGVPRAALVLVLLSLLVLLLPATRNAALVFMCVVLIGGMFELALMLSAGTAPGNWIGMLLAAAAGAELGRRSVNKKACVEGTGS